MASLLRRTLVGGAVVVVALLALLAATASAVRFFEAKRRPEEAARLVAELGVQPGMSVAEIGAGSGALAVEVARIVGSGGRVIATELEDGQVAAIRDAARRAGLSNLVAVKAGKHQTNLPAACCEVIYMQRVYHHLTDPEGVMASARLALKPGGRIGVIDFEPGGLGRLWTPRGVPDRGVRGDGIQKEALLREMKSFGFALRGAITQWSDRRYLAVFEVATSGSNDRPRRTRGIPVFASASFGR